MKKINPKIFREYDIRGIVGEDLSKEFAYVLGRAFAEYLREKGTIKALVARDTRITSEPYGNALTRGLTEGGCVVYDMGSRLFPLFISRDNIGKSTAVL